MRGVETKKGETEIDGGREKERERVGKRKT